MHFFVLMPVESPLSASVQRSQKKYTLTCNIFQGHVDETEGKHHRSIEQVAVQCLRKTIEIFIILKHQASVSYSDFHPIYIASFATKQTGCFFVILLSFQANT
jgi:hypothetical protein